VIRARNGILLVGLLLVTAGESSAHAARAPRRSVITAKSAILIDDQTGEVLWQHNPDLPLPPASTTIQRCLIATTLLTRDRTHNGNRETTP
jgi:D-alanyl-D-alanine carboxypeptidase